MENLEWLTWIGHLGNEMGPLANLLQVAGFLGLPTVIALWRWMRRRELRQEKIHEDLERAFIGRGQRIKDLEEEVAELELFDPRKWIGTAANEREAGNEELAIAALHGGVARTTNALYGAFLQLAGHHLSLYPDRGQVSQLQQAARMARIATLLEPQSAEAKRVLDEINATVDVQSLRDGSIELDDEASYLVETRAYGGQLGREVLNKLFTLERKHLDAGNYRISERLAYRARLIATRELGQLSSWTYVARVRWARALLHCGLHGRAKDEMDDVRSVEAQVHGLDQRDLLQARHQYAQILNNLGNSTAAIEELDRVIYAMEQKCDPGDDVLLVARTTRVQSLQNLRRFEEALEEIKQILAVRQKSDGPEHPNTLSTRSLWISTLISLGNYDDALKESELLMASRERVNGRAHSHTIAARVLRVRALRGLGHYQDALRELELVIPLRMQCSGSAHPDTLTALYLQAQMLDALDRHAEAFQVLAALLPIRERTSGSDHPHTLSTRYLKARVEEKLRH